MKVLSVNNLAVQIEFGENKSATILHEVETYEEVSSAGKRYVSQRLKWWFFPVWKECYYAVKGGKRFQDLYETIAVIMDPELDYSEYTVRKSEAEKVKACIAAYFEN